jgi:hypothetical protein
MVMWIGSASATTHLLTSSAMPAKFDTAGATRPLPDANKERRVDGKSSSNT